MSVKSASFPSSPFRRALAAAIEANVPVAITGHPGRGKTAEMENPASNGGRHCETVIGSNREASDFLGVMIEDKGVIKYSAFQWVKNLNNADKGLLLLDEFNTANPSTMKGMVRVVQERYVGDTKLKDSVSIVALMNPVETAVDAYDLTAPMANRMLHLDWEFNPETWLENVATDFKNVTVVPAEAMLTADPLTRKAAVAGAIITYLRSRPNLLAPVPPKDVVEASGAWASPRSWTNVINTLSQLNRYDDEAAFLVVKGLVGEGNATEYFAWLAAEDLHDPAEVIDGTVTVDWKNERPDRLFALVNAVATLGLSKPELWGKAAMVLSKCANGGKADVAYPSAEKLMNNMPAGIKGIPSTFKASFTDLFSNTRYKVAVAE